MDREQKAILENHGRGLGLRGDWEGASNWWGGRIQQILRLAKAPPESDQPYVVSLERLESRRSHRIARYLGSRRINQMRIDTELLNKERGQLHEFLLQRFVLCGRIYRPFASKDGTLYMMETDINYERTTIKDFGDQHRISFASFLNWHNPLYPNSNQVVFYFIHIFIFVAEDGRQPTSKWSTRWTLGLSTSRPVLEFAETDIYDDRSYCLRIFNLVIDNFFRRTPS
jgi:RNA-dependent RNA polymerase